MHSKEMLALNGICPYFTMFPLDFPLNILREQAQPEDAVLDPFCGRGTTNFAARLLGLSSLGIDSSPVAIAISAAKAVNVNVNEILEEARNILEHTVPIDIPQEEFWQWAYHKDVLKNICSFREAFLQNCISPARIALRGIILGALHGPKQKTVASYFSNQFPRTYSPKPAYSVRFWQEHNLKPEYVDVLDIIKRRAMRYYCIEYQATTNICLGDSRSSTSYQVETNRPFVWIITSPPYYGMRTYIPDQWLRNWFVGGSSNVDYSQEGQLLHKSPEIFIQDLKQVWLNSYQVAEAKAQLIIRFGGIADRKADPLQLITASLQDTGWSIQRMIPAGSAQEGRRQANSFLRKRSTPIEEFDIWARKTA